MGEEVERFRVWGAGLGQYMLQPFRAVGVGLRVGGVLGTRGGSGGVS